MDNVELIINLPRFHRICFKRKVYVKNFYFLIPWLRCKLHKETQYMKSFFKDIELVWLDLNSDQKKSYYNGLVLLMENYRGEKNKIIFDHRLKYVQ